MQTGSRVCGVIEDKELTGRLDLCTTAPLGYLLVVDADDQLLESHPALKRLGYQVLVQMRAGDQRTWLLQAA